MSPSHFKVKSLSGNIFSSVLVFALALIMVFGVVMTSIYYYSYEHDAEAKLSALASDAAKSLNETSSEANIPVLREQFAGMVRYTLIANDGTVLFDSVADEGSLGDHHERPEVLEADATGASTSCSTRCLRFLPYCSAFCFCASASGWCLRWPWLRRFWAA